MTFPIEKELVLKVATGIPKEMMREERDAAAIVNCIGDFWKLCQIFFRDGFGDVLLGLFGICEECRARICSEVAKETLRVVVADGIVDPQGVVHLLEAFITQESAEARDRKSVV